MLSRPRPTARVPNMANLFIFGVGYSGSRIANAALALGWQVNGTGSAGNMRIDDRDAVRTALDQATHILSSVPPEYVTGGDDVLMYYGDDLHAASGKWLGYLSSSGVYGDTGGAWADESAATGRGIRSIRAGIENEWLDLGAHVFRLPGIYGPRRNMFERIKNDIARRINMPHQVFSRVHVDDTTSAVVAAMTGNAPAGAYNIADDLPSSQNAVIEHACRLMGMPLPPLQMLEDADMSHAAKNFYAENRRVANGKAKRVLGWEPKYPTYREGLNAIWSEFNEAEFSESGDL